MCSLTKNQSGRDGTCTRARSHRSSRRSVGGWLRLEAAVLDARHEPHLRRPQSSSSGPWISMSASRGGGPEPTSMPGRATAAGAGRRRVVDAVDLARLRRAGGGRQREVGVAAGLAQDVQLVVHAAPAAVGPGVVQRPVAVDEAVRQARRCAGRARAGRAGRPAVAWNVSELSRRSLGGVVVVVEVDLDLAEAVAAEPGQARRGVPGRTPRSG